MAKPRTSPLTPKQEAFVNAKCAGLNDLAAAKQAGYSSAEGSAHQLKDSRPVQTALMEARGALMQVTNLRRQDIVNGVLEAIDRARMLGEPATEIRGWTELAKMLGFYAPEVKKIEITGHAGRIRQKFEALSDEELLEIASQPLIEGDFHVVN